MPARHPAMPTDHPATCPDRNRLARGLVNPVKGSAFRGTVSLVATGPLVVKANTYVPYAAPLCITLSCVKPPPDLLIVNTPLVRDVRSGHIKKYSKSSKVGGKDKAIPLKGMHMALGRKSDGAANGSPTNRRPPANGQAIGRPTEKGRLHMSESSCAKSTA
jgi:hypothetical protein